MKCTFLPGDRLVVVDDSPGIPGDVPFKLNELVTCSRVFLNELYQTAAVDLKEYPYRFGYWPLRFRRAHDVSQFHKLCQTKEIENV